MLASEDAEVPGSECYSPLSEYQHPQHNFAYQRSAAYIETGRADSPEFSESPIRTSYGSGKNMMFFSTMRIRSLIEICLEYAPETLSGDSSPHSILYPGPSPSHHDGYHVSCPHPSSGIHDVNRSHSESPPCPYVYPKFDEYVPVNRYPQYAINRMPAKAHAAPEIISR